MSTRTANGQSRQRPKAHDDWAVAVKTRAGWKCEGCGLEANWVRAHHGRFDACHILPYQEYPQLRFEPSNGRALCYFPRRNHPEGLGRGFGCHNAMSGHWKGESAGAVHHRGGRKGRAVGYFLLSLPVWWGAVLANAHLRYYAFLRSVTIAPPGSSGRSLLVCLGELLALWVASFLAGRHALSHHWFRRSAAFAWHTPGRLLGLMR